jgi:hypothetical protein
VRANVSNHAKPLDHAYFAALCREINLLRWSDPISNFGYARNKT